MTTTTFRPRVHARMKRLARLFDRVATFPRADALIWNGQCSFLATGIFSLVFAARLASPLQWLKYYSRRRISPLSIQGPQVRPDFHAAWTELYFLGTFSCVLLPLHLGNLAAVLTRAGAPGNYVSFVQHAAIGLAAVLLLEALVWLLYYGTLRGFIERDFTIYHRAEYVLMLPVILAQSAMAYAVMSKRTFWQCAGLMLDYHPDGQFTPSEELLGHAIFGLLFTVTITYLVSQFPPVRIKATERPDDRLSIVGNGDVVSRRIWPALHSLPRIERSAKVPADIVIFDAPGRSVPGVYVASEYADIPALVEARNAPAIVATPTNTHLDIFRALYDADRMAEVPHPKLRLAIEKPLYGPSQQAEFLAVLEAYGRSNIFALSYYYLERALPLVYLLTQEDSYVRYLERSRPVGASAVSLSESNSLHDLVLKLGAVTAIEGFILEGVDRSPAEEPRAWLLDPNHGGIAYEMMLHLLVLTHVTITTVAHRADGIFGVEDIHASAGIAFRRPSFLKRRRWPTALEICGRMGGAAVRLACAKYMPEDRLRRDLTVRLERGTIYCSFDEQYVEVATGDERHRLQVREAFRGVRYSVQMDLVRRFFDRGFWPWTRTDGLDAQLAALAWLDQHYASAINTDRMSMYSQMRPLSWFPAPASSGTEAPRNAN